MKIQPILASPWYTAWVVLALLGATVPAVPVRAQGAVQAVRQRVSGLEQGPEGPPAERGAPPGVAPPEQPLSPGSSAGKLDTTYVASTASVLIVLRPAQIMTAPIAQVLPTEIATAAGRQYLGIDPADVDELIAFGDLANPTAPKFGLTLKFNKPFRAASLPQTVRPMAQLAEFNGKKYLQSAHPIFPSFYGADNKTMIVAPDAVLRSLIESSKQQRTGGLLDRVREVPSGSDLYLAVDVASLRGAVQMGMAQAKQTMPPEAKLMLDSVAALELTVNVVSHGPVSLVLHCNDEAAAQQVEMALAAAKQSATAAPPVEQPGLENPVATARAQFHERMMQRYLQPQRNGVSITCINMAADDPLQQQLVGLVWGAVLGSKGASEFQAAHKVFQQPPGGPAGPTPEGSPVPPGPPGAPTAEGVAPPPGPPGVGPPGPPSPEAERR
jgi:hypothetical protein